MESSTRKSRGVDITKRGRSLDLKSLYKTRASEVGDGKKKISKEGDQQNVKKRSRKQLSLKCYESDPKKSRKEDVDSVKSDVSVRQKLSGRSKGLHGASLALTGNGNGNAFNFPKRPRGSVGHRKSKVEDVSKPLALPNPVNHVRTSKADVKKLKDESIANNQSTRSVKVHGDDASNSKSMGKLGGSNPKTKMKVNSESKNKGSSLDLKLKRKAGADEVMGRNRRLCSDGTAEKECSVAVNDGDTSSKKHRGNGRKKVGLVDGRNGDKALKKSEPSVGNSVPDRLVDFDEDDDDEENLEQNAARMLSSRFDPNCTGFSSKRKFSASQKANGSPLLVSSTRNSFSVQANSFGGVDSALADDKSRALRPRREDKGKDIQRKRRRRHFYEILPRNLEPHWFLDRRIKVFWPLDESWYVGLVNNYHPDCKLYHIKYDDRDEEWIDLQEEKFKILLFPSEVPGKAKSKKAYKVDNNVHKVETVQQEADSWHRGDYHDSEPIASWLACSSQHVKSLPKYLEIQQNLHIELPTASSSSHELNGNLNNKVADSKRTGIQKDCEYTSADNSLMGGAAGIRAVYVRKKNRKSSETYGSAFGTFNTVASVTGCLASAEEEKLCYRYADSDTELWSINRQGQLKAFASLDESQKFRLHIFLPVLSSIRFFLGTEYLWLLHDILMVQLGLILPTSPAVMLEMFFMDNDLGLRFFMFDGCMELALAFIFQLLDLFSKPDQQMDGSVQWPVTSIRFKLSSVQDVRKHHTFEFHCFSRLPNSKWACLNTRLQQHCLLLKQLSVSECTYDNIKELEYRILKQYRVHFGLEHSVHADFGYHFFLGRLPMEFSNESCTTRFGPALNLARKHGKFPQFVVLFSVAPTLYLTGHLKLLMESSSGRGSLEALRSPESLENGSRNCLKRSQPGFSREGHRSNSVFSSLADNPSMRPGGSHKFMPIGFSNGPKKPRTQVQYTLPDASYDIALKQKMQNQRASPCKRIRRASLKRISDVSLDNQRNLELLACGANVLITHGDKGWRECGALIVLECADHNEWRLAIKLSGVAKYSYKVKHALQPGSTNRYSHAVLWKGGKDWVLEFSDRSQWNLFKEMYEECYSRNIRAASVKYIPIPGVKLIEGSDDYGSEVLSNWNSADYIKQVQTDVEMALDPSQILYDMDSDDEKWLKANKNFNDGNSGEEITDELLEKIMDMFEKISYTQHRNDFTDAEIQEIVIGIGSVEASKIIYAHWREKRMSKGMPLIRHLQPPLWQRYQQQLREWECAVARVISANCAGTQEKTPPPEKPAMFAFCLKPRGLDVPNKGSKPRSHRKFTVSGHLHAASRDHYGSLVYGRRPNGYIFGDEKVFYTSGLFEFSEFLPPLWSSNRKMKRYTARRRKNRRYKNRCGVLEWNMGLPYSAGQHYDFERPHRQGVGNMDLSDLNDIQLREALFVAQYAQNIAKIKREKARRLSNRAEVAIHKAAVALMTADAVKAAYEDLNGVTK